MELTAKTLGDLIKSLRSTQAGAGQKRTAPRVGVRIKVELLLLDPNTGFGAERITAWVRDISASGVGLLCNRAFKKDEAFDLLLAEEADNQERVPCFITYCRAVGADLFRLGAKFQGYEPKDQNEQ